MTFFAHYEPWVQALAGLAVLVALAMLLGYAATLLLMPVLRRMRRRARLEMMQVLLHDKVVRRATQIIPTVIVGFGIDAVPHLPPTLVTVVNNVAVAVLVVQVVRTLTAVLDAMLDHHQQTQAISGASQTRSIKSYVQLGKLLLMVAAAVVAAAVLLNRSPLIVLSGLGAMSAVLMLVFKDTILSFTAGVLLTSNDMLRLGDWIEMPQVGADGAVVDMALHTVKVQNWDKTITTIPTWRLMSESYRNWRGMSESGGRRIKRTIRLDASSIQFLCDEQMGYLSNIALLRPYLLDKRETLTQLNAKARDELGETVEFPANQRRLTNIGTFRAYVETYLRHNPRVHQGMTLMVRTLEPTPEGVPVELYCFCASTAWADYESTQGDIFDHLLAILPEFGLRLYQKPSGSDLRLGMAQRAETGQVLRYA